MRATHAFGVTKPKKREVAAVGVLAVLALLLYLAIYCGLIALVVWVVVLVLQHTSVIG